MPDFSKQTVRIADLGADTRVLVGLAFESCEIVGPAVIIPSGCSFIRCSYGVLDDDPQTLLWPLTPERTTMQGAVLLEACTFTDCAFRRVGIALAPDDVEDFLAVMEPAASSVGERGARTPVAS